VTRQHAVIKANVCLLKPAPKTLGDKPYCWRFDDVTVFTQP